MGELVSQLQSLTLDPEPRSQLISLRDTAARVVRARHGGADGEDLVQEAWTRVALALRERPIDDPHAYTAGVAANLVRGRYRQDRRRQRRAPLLFMRHAIEAPDGAVVRQEEGDALAAALGRLPAEARTLLVAHVVDGLDTATLAERAGSTPGAVAAGLARARAMLRVEYLIAFRRLPDPPERCRRVCYAVSANDARRERRLNAVSHLSDCTTCRDITSTLRERRRPAMLGALLLRLSGRFSGWGARASAIDWQGAAPRAGLVGAGVVGAIAIGGVLAPSLPARSAVPTAPGPAVIRLAPAIPAAASPSGVVARSATTPRVRWVPAAGSPATPATHVAPTVSAHGRTGSLRRGTSPAPLPHVPSVSVNPAPVNPAPATPPLPAVPPPTLGSPALPSTPTLPSPGTLPTSSVPSAAVHSVPTAGGGTGTAVLAPG